MENRENTPILDLLTRDLLMDFALEIDAPFHIITNNPEIINTVHNHIRNNTFKRKILSRERGILNRLYPDVFGPDPVIERVNWKTEGF